jgi:hypothetical protein
VKSVYSQATLEFCTAVLGSQRVELCVAPCMSEDRDMKQQEDWRHIFSSSPNIITDIKYKVGDMGIAC